MAPRISVTIDNSEKPSIQSTPFGEMSERGATIAALRLARKRQSVANAGADRRARTSRRQSGGAATPVLAKSLASLPQLRT